MSAQSTHSAFLDPRVIRCEPSAEDLADMAAGILDDPGYRVDSEIPSVSSAHFIDIVDGEWRVQAAQAHEHLTVEEARTYVRELSIAIAAAANLTRLVTGGAQL